jgi:hypothetical protein
MIDFFGNDPTKDYPILLFTTHVTQGLNIRFSFAPLGATHNNPPHRGGLLCNTPKGAGKNF